MIIAWAFLRDSAKPRSTSSRSTRSLHDVRLTILSAISRNRCARSPNLFIAPSAWSRCSAAWRREASTPYSAGNVAFLLRGVFARRLAKVLGCRDDIEDIVHDLECQTDVLAVAAQRVELLLRRPGRRWPQSSPKRESGRRFSIGECTVGASLQQACLRLRGPPPARRSCRRRCRRLLTARPTCARAAPTVRPPSPTALERRGSATRRRPAQPWRRRKPCGR